MKFKHKNFMIELSNGEKILTCEMYGIKLIDIVDMLTKYKISRIEDIRNKTHYIFRKHIVKITEVNKMSENISYNKIIEKLEDENKQLKKEIDDFYYEQSKLKESDFYIKTLKNKIERLKDSKYKYIELYKQKQDENHKLSNELTLKTRQNSILSLEINELQKELKEYRGF